MVCGREKSFDKLSELDDSIEKLQPPIIAYSRRWYVLAVFTVLAFTQGAVWNTWGPISDSAIKVFKWNNADIATFANLGNIAYCISVFPISYMLDTIGMRIASLACCGMILVGCVLRCISSNAIVQLWMSNVAAILCGAAGPVTFAGPALFSSTWFPADQRATATAIVSLGNYMGVAIAFVIGPLLVPSRAIHPDHGNSSISNQSMIQNSSANRSAATGTIIAQERSDIMRLMYIECGWTAALLLLIIVYFPARPPAPPSMSSFSGRINFLAGVKRMVMSNQFWFLALAYALPTGPFGAWNGVINVTFFPVGVSQSNCGWIGFGSTMASCLMGLAISRFADVFSKHMRAILIAFYIAGSGCFVWAIMLRQQYIGFSLAQLYVSVILANTFINGAVPLFYELGSEVCYPVSEGIVGGALTFLNNLLGTIFLAIVTIKQLGTSWIMWSLLACAVASLPLLLLLKETYGRLQVDTGEQEDEEKKPIASPVDESTNYGSASHPIASPVEKTINNNSAEQKY